MTRQFHIWARWLVVLAFGLLVTGCGQGGQPRPGSGDSGQGSQPGAPPVASSTPTGPPAGPDAPVTGPAVQGGGPSGGPGVGGVVRDAGGRPVVGILVTPRSTDNPPQGVPEIAVTTDAQGRYHWPLPPGAYALTFTGEGYAPTTAPVVVKPGQVATLDVTLQRQGG